MNRYAEDTVPIRIVHRHYPVSLDGMRMPEYDPPTEVMPAFMDWPTQKLPIITKPPPAEPVSRVRELLGVARDIAYVSFGKYGQYLVTVATLPLMARVLGTEGLGLLAIGMSSYFIGSLLVDLGITSYMAARVQESSETRSPAEQTASINRTRGTYLVIRGGILGAVTLALAVVLAVGAPEYLRMIALGLFIGGVWSMSEDWLLIGQGRFGASTLYQAVARIAYLLLLVLVLPRIPTAEVALLCLLGNSVLCVALTWWDTWRGFGPPGRPRGVVALLRASAPVVTGRLLVTSYGQGSATVFGAVLNAASLGLYSASDRLVRAVQSLLDAIGFALLPRMAKRGGDERFWPDALRALTVCVGLACAASALLWLLAPVVVPLIFGDQFAEAVAVLRLEVLILPATTITSFITTAILPVRQDTIGVLIGALVGTCIAGVALLIAARTHSVWTLVGGIVAAEFAVALWYLARTRGLIVRERAAGGPLPAGAERRTR
ncbi:lipopolysaccharide biosynthesis protein [Nocardia sp. NPDC057227]|uniref:lipopolysaccharide biosynthesis protein n=1 Tax=Nocardia sp. NPDC057227 TaxID=3346056 RepID=UPI00362DCF22